MKQFQKEFSTQFNGDKTHRSAKAETVFKFLQEHNISMSSAKYPQQGGQGRENTSHKS